MSQYYTPPQTYLDGQTLTALDLNNDTAAVNTAFTNLEADLAVQNENAWLANFRDNLIVNGDGAVWNVNLPTADLNDSDVLMEMFFYAKKGTGITENCLRLSTTDILPAATKLATRIQNTSTGTLSSDFLSAIEYRMEGNDFIRMYPKRATCCFWARSSVAGEYSFSYTNGEDRWFVTSFTLAADTWKQVFIPIMMDTVSEGTWRTGRATAFQFYIVLNSGADNKTATPNTWQNTAAYAVQNQTNLSATLNATFDYTAIWILPYAVPEPPAGANWLLPPCAKSPEQDLEATERYYESSKYFFDRIPGTPAVPPNGASAAHVYSSPPGERKWTILFNKTKIRGATVTIYNASTGAVGSVFNDIGATSHPVTVTYADSDLFVMESTSGAGNTGTHVYFDWTANARQTRWGTL